MTDNVKTSAILRTEARLPGWLRRLFSREPSRGSLPRLYPEALSAAMLRDIGLGEREIGQLTYLSNPRFDSRFG